MILLKNQKIVIITPPKTASSSLHMALCRQEYGGIMVVGESMYPGNVDKHVCKIPNEAAGYKVLAVTRNPYDRLVSLYCHYAREESQYHGRFSMAFWEFANRVAKGSPITGQSVDPLYAWTLCKHLEGVHVDTILRCESLVEDLAQHGLEVALTRENTSYRRAWQDYYEPGLLLTVSSWAEHDCERYGYETGQHEATQ